MIRKISFVVMLVFCFGMKNAYAELVIEALPEGERVLDTANTLHQVEVRLQSLGTGVCQTNVQLGNELHNLLAAFGGMSSWYRLSPAVSGVAIKIKMWPGCDANVVGEVRYHKK